jgi:hypothetical protein
MSSEPTPPSSFSAQRRWAIFFSVLISIVTVFALVAMLNYLGARYYMRFNWSKDAAVQLSPQTVSLLKTITNQINVTIYFDKTDGLYDSTKALLDEYHLANPKIVVQTVDYLVDASLAQQVKATNQLGSDQKKNLVIFNSGGRRKIVQAPSLADYTYESVPNNKEREWAQHLKDFKGEIFFSSAILSLSSPHTLKAYFLEGHGEHGLESKGDDGYQKFGEVCEGNNVQTSVIKLFGTNNVPSDCNLLVIAGPRNPIPAEELHKISTYLSQGGRLLALFNYDTRFTYTGLEPILTNWNVSVGMNVVSDPKNKMTSGALAVSAFNPNQPISAELVGSTLAMVNPRSVSIASLTKDGPETPKVEELAMTGEDSTYAETSASTFRGRVPVICTVEKASIKGVFSERGTTAIVVAGDSVFLDNLHIDDSDDRAFATSAINWLLDQTQLLQGVGPRAVKEYKLTMTQSQMSHVTWLFLGAMPGAILFLGLLVWLRRRR